MKYEIYPCAKCGRKIIIGNRTKIGIVCNCCYKIIKNKIIKMEGKDDR